MPTRRRSRKGEPPSRGLAELFEPYVWDWFTRTFGQPSPPQLAAWPVIAKGRNTLIFSPTGSGKTLAAFLWCINDLFRMGREGTLSNAVHVLYISPLKALNNDIQKNLVEPLAGIRRAAERAGVEAPEVRSQVRTGDTPTQERAAMTRRPPHILITTPESLFIILSTPKFRRAFRSVRHVIVDEIHALSDNKRGVHLALSLERLQHLADAEFVRIGCSATQKPLEEIARFLAGMDASGAPRPCEIVDVGARKNLNVSVISPVDNLLEAHFDAIWGSAYDHLLSMIARHDTTLVFTNSRYKTERTALRLNELSVLAPVHVGAHHGSMSKDVRLDMENRLKRGKLDALVATSSLELGIDVGSIDLVCQIESPKSVSRGMQRIGRAGHLLDATSEGRLLVTDRDDLVESAVLVKAILDGEIDTTRVPRNCLDVLAQHVVGAVAADDWDADELFALCRRAHCYSGLDRAHFDRVLDMLAGNVRFGVEREPFPKIFWDKVNGLLTPERGARMLAYRASGTIPDVGDYDVYFESKKTRVGQLDEGFVEMLHVGDIFVLGSSAWRVTGIQRNRVLVADVYGQPPTIPYWQGDRSSRTFDLGLLVGRFRRRMAERLQAEDPLQWLQDEYCVDEDGARAICEYFREQELTTGIVPSDVQILVEQFTDELGQEQIVIHSSFGIHVNDTWAMALAQAIEHRYGFHPPWATVDDGILITLARDTELEGGAASLLDLVSPENLDAWMAEALIDAPVFASRFRHNAVRSLMVLREYQGRRTPVWLQNLRASTLLEGCRGDRDLPLVVETLRECMHEALDVPSLRRVLDGLREGDIQVASVRSSVPSPFAHSLLLVGQYGDMGSIPARERRSRLMHLHRELLRQILDEETLRNLLDPAAVEQVEARAQHTAAERRARDANELARILIELGDMVDGPDEEMSLQDRVAGDVGELLAELVESRRVLLAPIPTVETTRERWVATENFPLYRAAFGTEAELDGVDRKILDALARKGPCPLARLGVRGKVAERVERLLGAYRVVRLAVGGQATYAAAEAWVPKKILRQKPSREDARLELVAKFVRSHGPLTKYEVMERYGFPEHFVEAALGLLLDQGEVASGEYVPTKSFPQWCHKAHLEAIHRLTLSRLRKEMEPATAVEYADFLVRWQHVHPATQLTGTEGLLEVLGQLQGLEFYTAVVERELLASRVRDYDPWMLDRLCYGGEVAWRRFDPRKLSRGRIGFCLRDARPWLLPHPDRQAMDLKQWDDDIPAPCDAVREHLASHGASFFDDIVAATGLDWRIALRAVWHLVWTGEATNDSYEAIRHSAFTTGLSACYDLDSRPGKATATLERIVHHMIDYRKLDPRLGRWSPTERLVPDSLEPAPPEEAAMRWAHLLLSRYGIVCRDVVKREVCAPRWRDLRRALIRLELLGKIRRGFFVQELAGEQFASPEAVEALREAKVRHAQGIPDDEPMILLDARDPANPFGTLLPTTNEVGEEARTRPARVVVRAGQPVLLGGCRVLADLSRRQAEDAIATLMARGEVRVSNWNGHPIDVSPARHLLTRLGFVQDRRKEFVYDGRHLPDAATAAEAERDIPALFEREGKEAAPVSYDADWIVARSNAIIRPKVRELIDWLGSILRPECELTFRPRGFVVQYRGVRCIHPLVQQKQIWLQITHRGWTRGLRITPETDLNAPDFVARTLERFEDARRKIDAELDRRRG